MLVVENSIFQPPDKLDVTFNEIDLQTFTNNKDRCWMTLVHYNKRSISQSAQDLQTQHHSHDFHKDLHGFADWGVGPRYTLFGPQPNLGARPMLFLCRDSTSVLKQFILILIVSLTMCDPFQ